MNRKIYPKAVCFLLLFALCFCSRSTPGQASENGTEDKVLNVFHPYRQGPPQVEGITPGMSIDKSNFQVAQEVLPPEILKYLQAGDFAITVQETTDLPPREEYINVTLQHYAQVEVMDGELKNYMAGRPFPLIDPQDPQAGEKMAWNYRYRDSGDTMQSWPTSSLIAQSGSVERSSKMYTADMYGMHRCSSDANLATWEKEQVYFKRYSRILAPLDMEGGQMLTNIQDKDTVMNEQWAYDPKTRRTRKIVYNPYEASGNMDYLVEDWNGFNGYIHVYNWKYLGEKIVLAPGFIKTAEPKLGGKGNWYPADSWELRKAIVIEGVPKKSHPTYGRRVIYIDLQTNWALHSLAFNHEGEHFRTFFMMYGNPEFSPRNQGIRIPILTAQSAIDYHTERAGLFMTHKVIYNQPLKEKMFRTGALLRYGK